MTTGLKVTKILSWILNKEEGEGTEWGPDGDTPYGAATRAAYEAILDWEAALYRLRKDRRKRHKQEALAAQEARLQELRKQAGQEVTEP